MAVIRRKCMFAAFAYLILCAPASAAGTLLMRPGMRVWAHVAASAITCSGSAMCRSLLQESKVIAAGVVLVVQHAMLASGMLAAGDITCIWCSARFRATEFRNYCNERCRVEHQGKRLGKSKEQIERKIERDCIKKENEKRRELEKQLETSRKLVRQKSDDAVRRRVEESERKERIKKEQEEREREKKEQERRERERKQREKKEQERREKEAKELRKKEEKAIKELERLRIKEEKEAKKRQEDERKRMEETARSKARQGRVSITGQSPVQEISCQGCLSRFSAIDYQEFCSDRCKAGSERRTWPCRR